VPVYVLIHPAPSLPSGVTSGLVVSLLVHQVRQGRPSLQVTRIGGWTLLVSVAMALFQPMLGVWGLLGAWLGGTTAALGWVLAIDVLRYLVFIPLFLAAWLVEKAYGLLAWLPRILVGVLSGLMGGAWRLIKGIAEAFRDIK
jgi:hypothetical protein